MQQHLFEYFSREDHSSFLDDVSIIFIDKTDPKDPNNGSTPQGLNVEDD